ncbi:hypothetical protein U1Q18_043589, partial [Sarracenia purpurea var. burkii]
SQMGVAAVLEVAPEDAEQATQVEEEKSEAEEDPIDMLAGNFYSPGGELLSLESSPQGRLWFLAADLGSIQGYD